MSFENPWKAIALVLALVVCAPSQAQQAGIGSSEAGDRGAASERRPDPARGERLFRECRKCHEIQPGAVKIGPSLAGVVGRRPGSVPNFGYSQDMIEFGASGAVWDQRSLDRFLTRPRALINGTKMVFQGFRKPADRADVIAYLSNIRS